MSYRDEETRSDHDVGPRHQAEDSERTVVEDRRYVRDSGRDVAHERFGGMHIGAQMVGMLTALSLTLLLAGTLGAAVGGVAFETGIDENLDASATEISLGSVIAGIVLLAIAFFVGGWAAGRMSRYDGGRNGLMTAVWFLVLGLILAALGLWAGSEYNVAHRVDLLPDWFGTWFERDDVTMGAILSGVVAILVILLAGFIGGKVGERFHRRADDVIAAHESGGVVRERRLTEREARG
jgi:hypothetical protein